jgi:hypothetical protein
MRSYFDVNLAEFSGKVGRVSVDSVHAVAAANAVGGANWFRTVLSGPLLL